jgi:hypothetical protein
MKQAIIILGLVGGFIIVSTAEAGAVVCARGVYRAGCVGPRGAVGVRGSTVIRHGTYGYRGGTVVHRSTVVRRRVR